MGEALPEVVQIGKPPEVAHTYSFHGVSLLPTEGGLCRLCRNSGAWPSFGTVAPQGNTFNLYSATLILITCHSEERSDEESRFWQTSVFPMQRTRFPSAWLRTGFASAEFILNEVKGSGSE